MSIRLVDKDNVFNLSVGNLRDIGTAAQGFADAINGGDLDGLETAIVIIKVNGRVDMTVMGESPSIAEGLGLLELAKAKIIAGAWLDD